MFGRPVWLQQLPKPSSLLTFISDSFLPNKEYAKHIYIIDTQKTIILTASVIYIRLKKTKYHPHDLHDKQRTAV